MSSFSCRRSSRYPPRGRFSAGVGMDILGVAAWLVLSFGLYLLLRSAAGWDIESVTVPCADGDRVYVVYPGGWSAYEAAREADVGCNAVRAEGWR